MRIMILGSMSFADKMVEAKEMLEQAGHHLMVSSFVANHLGKTHAESEAQALVEKEAGDAMRVDFEKLHHVDAVLALNYTKRGIENYVGGNTLMELGLAHVLHRKIFLLNPVPKIEYYQSEIHAMHPVILYGDLSLIRDEDMSSSVE